MAYFVHDECLLGWMLQFLRKKKQTALYEALTKLEEGSFLCEFNLILKLHTHTHTMNLLTHRVICKC